MSEDLDLGRSTCATSGFSFGDGKRAQKGVEMCVSSELAVRSGGRGADSWCATPLRSENRGLGEDFRVASAYRVTDDRTFAEP
jgi:hypothetical protein